MTKQILVLPFVFFIFSAKAATMSDPYLWLEDRNGAKAVEWAQHETESTRATLEAHPHFAPAFGEIQKILTDVEKLPSVKELSDGFVYDLWQDTQHPRGLFRRSPFAAFKTGHAEWDILIDVDALATAENTPWVFKSIQPLAGTDRALIALSKNGQDAVEFREFSLSTKTFIAEGFVLPESKSSLVWQDLNHLLVASSLSAEDRTESGYARTVYRWTRGEPFAGSPQVYQAEKESVVAFGITMQDGSSFHSFVGKFFGDEKFEMQLLGEKGELLKLPFSLDADPVLLFEGQILYQLRKPWRGFVAGSVLAIPLSSAGRAEVPVEEISVVFKPTAHTSYLNMGRTRDQIYLLLSENVKGQVYKVTYAAGTRSWHHAPVFKSAGSTFQIGVLDSQTDAALFSEEGFLQPRQILAREGGVVSKVQQAKSWFDESKFVTEQHWVKSKDGVEIPYSVVRAKDFAFNGAAPTLLYGYGGFQISVLPTYSAVNGSQWLAKGGVYVVANIRGGGEFGPAWHQAAILENKQKSYDDFIAVAEDLIARKITNPAHLGIQGGSNGGLLVAAVAMQRPELFNAVLCQIPLLDMIRYTQLPPGASWASEYGDPADPKMREVILKYSPYQNVAVKKPYPKMLFQTTQADDRVHPGHARKMVARMKEYGHTVYLLESADGGHGGGGVKPEDQARTLADLYTYLHAQLTNPSKW